MLDVVLTLCYCKVAGWIQKSLAVARFLAFLKDRLASKVVQDLSSAQCLLYILCIVSFFIVGHFKILE